MHDIRCQCHRSLEMTIIKGWPMSQYMWHVKEPSLLNGHECQAYRVGQNLKPFAIYGEVSINAWKILKWNNKSETNKPKWVRVTCTEEWGPLISIMYFNRILMGNQLKSKCSYSPAKTYWTFLELFQNISDFFLPEHPELSLKCSITYQVHY